MGRTGGACGVLPSASHVTDPRRSTNRGGSAVRGLGHTSPVKGQKNGGLAESHTTPVNLCGAASPSITPTGGKRDMPTWAALWVATGAMAFGIDVCAWYLRLSGAFGEPVRAYAQWYVDLNGGMRQMAVTVLFVNVLVPPVALVVCLVSLRLDWIAYKRTRATPG